MPRHCYIGTVLRYRCSLRCGGALAKAHARYGDPLEEARRDNGASRILLQLRLELGQFVAAPECVDRFPDDVVHEQAAARDTAMELRRDQPRLLSHDRELLLEAFHEIV